MNFFMGMDGLLVVVDTNAKSHCLPDEPVPINPQSPSASGFSSARQQSAGAPGPLFPSDTSWERTHRVGLRNAFRHFFHRESDGTVVYGQDASGYGPT